jgi:hypothetical protein
MKEYKKISHRGHRGHRVFLFFLCDLCITILQNLVFIPRFFLRHLRIPAAIIGWGCHPLCDLCGKKIGKIGRAG